VPHLLTLVAGRLTAQGGAVQSEYRGISHALLEIPKREGVAGEILMRDELQCPILVGHL
jgi:hypothetical protein